MRLMFRVAYFSMLTALLLAPFALFNLASHADHLALSLLVTGIASCAIGLSRRP